MAREERFYAFIIAHTSRSRARVQRIRIEKRVITIFSGICLLVALGIVFGFYGLAVDPEMLLIARNGPRRYTR